jgi:hypothetical protein
MSLHLGQQHKHTVYISMSIVVCLSFDMSQTTMRPTMRLAPLETPQWIGVHLGSFVMFKPTLWELLNIELFFHKISIKSFLLLKKRGTGLFFWYCWKMFNQKGPISWWSKWPHFKRASWTFLSNLHVPTFYIHVN